MNEVLEALVVKRTYRQRPDLIFRAWTEPERLEKWFSPNPQAKVTAKVDLRVGGQYRIEMAPAAGEPWIVSGEYLEITRPEKLVFTWQWDHETETSKVAVCFNDMGDGTEVVVTHELIKSEQSRETSARNWNVAMMRLEEYLLDPMEFGMGTLTDIVTAAANVKQARLLAQFAISRMRDTFSHVPEEKLHWTPGGPSKSALQIYAHTALSNRYFAAILRGDNIESKPFEELLAELNAKAATYKSRSDADALFKATSTEVLDSYDQLAPDRLLTDPRATFVLTLVARHVDSHAAQIDYLQTIWGDLQDHFGL